MRKLIFLFLIGSIFACVSPAERQVEQEYDRFFELSLRNQHEEFAQFSLPKQFDIFLYAVSKRHPADYSFAYDIASIRGKEVLPFLIDRLRGSSDETVQQSIIYIFEALVRKGYELRFNDRLIKLVRDKINLMKQPFSKQASERSLSAILEGVKRSEKGT